MKIMHIADLHIGRTINQFSLLNDQQMILSQLIERIDEEGIDVLVIAGDIYDRSIPSKEAMQVYESFLLSVNVDRKIPVLAVSGNHDGAERLGHARNYFKQFQYYLSTTIEDSLTPVIIDDVHFYLVPYIDPAYARQYFNDESIRTHQDTYQKIISNIENNMNKNKKNILISHLFVAGGAVTESERELVIGTVEHVNKSLFDEFDYTLLGHLHTPDAIKDEKVFYSGSLMRYSFSEIGQRKGYRIFDLNENVVHFKPLKYERDLEVAQGTFNEAMQLQLECNQHAYLRLELSEMEAINEPMAKLKHIYPNLLELKPILKANNTFTMSKDVTSLNTMDLIATFYQEMTEETLDDQQIDTLHSLLTAGGDSDET
ncbi:exonuclease SbcCD subunit D [Macrococcoides goetzii]|nr:exonuclease SbcCD subunit D [Macrococcus goetzii]TDM42314.1 exonuclease SbcCD subunit D [Macrococcus goetzii]